MNKKFKLLSVLVAIGAFSLNLSLNEDGSFTFFSSSKANSVQSETNPKGWRSETFYCTNDKGVRTGQGSGCMAGIAVSCTPVECGPIIPPVTPTPD